MPLGQFCSERACSFCDETSQYHKSAYLPYLFGSTQLWREESNRFIAALRLCGCPLVVFGAVQSPVSVCRFDKSVVLFQPEGRKSFFIRRAEGSQSASETVCKETSAGAEKPCFAARPRPEKPGNGIGKNDSETSGMSS